MMYHDEEEQLIAEEKKVKRRVRRYRPIRSLFLLDVISDEESRPALLYALGTLAFGTVAYHLMEGWSYLDSMYFCVISLATVGYGDLTPTTDVAKIFTIVYILNGIAILLSLFDRIRHVRSQRVTRNGASTEEQQ